jgi:hypothetical protein
MGNTAPGVQSEMGHISTVKILKKTLDRPGQICILTPMMFWFFCDSPQGRVARGAVIHKRA